MLDKATRQMLINEDAKSGEVVFRYLVGDEILSGEENAERYVIDFQQRNIITVQEYQSAFEYIQSKVLSSRKKAADKGRDNAGNMRSHHKHFLERWWKLAWDRADMIQSFSVLHGRIIVCSRVTKRPVFVFISTFIRPGDALQVFSFDDDYSFGILQSAAHWLWFTTKCSKLTERSRYTPDSVFDTFPWPQTPNGKQIEAVANAGREVCRVRSEALATMTGGLRAVYRTLELPGANPLKVAHAKLDAAVLAAYGFSAKGDILAQLLELNRTVSNRTVSNRILQDASVTPLGIPPSYQKPDSLISTDCISP